jgi:hypothetical protein
MKTKDFVKKLTSADLKENISRQFGVNVEFDSYDREQLEDFRNKLRTRVFQKESVAGINALLTDEAYQKDKAMLELLNKRIKEMLGEDLKKLRDKIDALEEAKKGVRAPKYTKKAKGAGDGNLANNYPPYDKVTRGDVIAGATGKDQKGGKKKDVKADEGRRISGKGYDNPEHDSKPPEGKVPFTSFHQGKQGDQAARLHATQVKGKLVKGKAQSAKQDEPGVKEEKFDPLKHVKNPTPGEKKAAKDVKRSSYADRAAMLRSAEKDGRLKEADDKCNHTPKGKKCPVHGLKECGTMEGKDEGKPGKNFAKIAKKAGEKYGSKAAGERVAGAVRQKLKKAGKLEETSLIFKRHVRIVNESLAYLLSEDEEGKAKTITAAGDMVNDYTSWMQRVGQYQTKSMIELADAIRADFGPAEAEAFKQAVGPALSATLEVLTQQREAISNAVAALAGGTMPGVEPMGMEPGMDTAAPDMMNEPAADEFGAADAAAGGPEAAGREMRESKFSRKLAESHSIISRLAK